MKNIFTAALFAAVISAPVFAGGKMDHSQNYASGRLTRFIFELDSNNKIRLTNIGKILLKSVMVFILFNAISYPLWRYVIFVEKK